MSKSFVSESLEETVNVGRELATTLEALSRSSIVLLQGPFGSGKTTLTKSIISELTDIPQEEIVSPTFQYVSLYTSKKGLPIAHFDLWRLSEKESFFEMGLDEILFSSLSFVEWPERLHGLLLSDTTLITIETLGEMKRCFTIEAQSV